MELTILMPCLNEARTLPGCISEATGFLRLAGVDGEVLVADNGSTDGSQALARGMARGWWRWQSGATGRPCAAALRPPRGST